MEQIGETGYALESSGVNNKLFAGATAGFRKWNTVTATVTIRPLQFLFFFLSISFCTSALAQKGSKHLAQVRLNGKYGFIDTSGKEVIPLVYDDAGSWGNNLVPVNIGKRIQEPTPVVEMIPEPRPVNTKDSGEETKHEEQYKIVDIPPDQAGKWGYCNASGQLVIPVQFTSADFFNEGLAGVEINGKWGFINTSGKMAVQPVYDKVGYFSQGLAVVVKEGNYGYINAKGEEVIKPQYADADAFKNGYAKVYEKFRPKNNAKTGYGRLIDLHGTIVTNARYDIQSLFPNGLASFSLSDTTFEESFIYGLINTKGEIVAPPGYREISDFSDGLARVMVYNRHEFYDEFVPNYGYIDTRGKEVVKPKLANAESYRYGMAVVARFDSIDDGASDHALMNTKGAYILGFDWKYLAILDKNQLLAIPLRNGYEKTIIDNKGKIILSLGDNGLRDLGNGLFAVINTNEEPVGFIGLDKKAKIDASKNKNRKFISYQSGLIRFQHLSSTYEERNNITLGLIDLNGHVIFEPKYNEIADFVPTDSPL
jgi:hypothetical protein